MVKNLSAMQETWVSSLDWEGPLKEGILARRILMVRGAWQATVQGVAKSGTQLSTQHILHIS